MQLYFFIAAPINIFLLYLTFSAAPKVPNKDKNEIFECAFLRLGDTRDAFDVQYYLTGGFIFNFDVELALFIPWRLLHIQLTLSYFNYVIFHVD